MPAVIFRRACRSTENLPALFGKTPARSRGPAGPSVLVRPPVPFSAGSALRAASCGGFAPASGAGGSLRTRARRLRRRCCGGGRGDAGSRRADDERRRRRSLRDGVGRRAAARPQRLGASPEGVVS